MVLLKTTDPNKQNRSLILPHLGEVIIPASGVIEVISKEIAALVVEANAGFDLFNGSFEDKVEEISVADIINENVSLKEENLKLSLENNSLKKEKAALILNQKPITPAPAMPAAAPAVKPIVTPAMPAAAMSVAKPTITPAPAVAAKPAVVVPAVKPAV